MMEGTSTISKSHRKQCVVFCHGFGFDASFWDALRPYFVGLDTFFLDLGYFSETHEAFSQYLCWAKAQPTDTDFIGVGHSIGLIKLLSLNLSFKYLVGLHGFVNFLGEDAALHRRRQRELSVLTKHCMDSPALTLQAFYQRAGVDFTAPLGHLNQQRLLDDLALLATPIAIPKDIPLLILGSNDDKITPPALLLDNFGGHHQVTVEILDQVQHGLGYLKPAEVYQRIMRFLEEVSHADFYYRHGH